MKFEIPSSDYKIVEGLEARGDLSHRVHFIANLNNSNQDSLTFFSGLNLERAALLEIGILLVDIRLKEQLFEFKSKCVVFCDLPKYRFTQVLSRFFTDSFDDIEATINLKISTKAFVEEGAFIGENTEIYPNASIFKATSLGKNCIVQSGSVIGGNGLGDVKFEGQYHRFTHLGKLEIADNVHIGCNVSVLRGMLEDTRIGSGTRIANNVNIGHNVVIEENCYISSGVTIGGACVIKKNSWLSVGVTLSDHVEVGENSMIGTGAVLIKDALPNSLYLGNPARRVGDRK
ncbi:MAG: UDP-3-O-[3-hydroxymyristoyl] glucosamine N-acyltransferase [Parvicella sp.]